MEFLHLIAFFFYGIIFQALAFLLAKETSTAFRRQAVLIVIAATTGLILYMRVNSAPAYLQDRYEAECIAMLIGMTVYAVHKHPKTWETVR